MCVLCNLAGKTSGGFGCYDWVGVDGERTAGAAIAAAGSFAVSATGSSTAALDTDAQFAAAFYAMKGGGLSVLDTQLASLWFRNSPQAASMAAFTISVAQPPNSLSSDGQFVLIDATAKDGDGAALLAQLQAIGLTQGSSFSTLASGFLPVSQIDALVGIKNLAFARADALYGSAGSAYNQGDHAMHGDTARATYGVDGTGIKIGILSDSFNNLHGMSADIASGDLPSSVTILQDLPNGGTDEGRGMAQLAHDIAPGSPILFATATTGMAGFANNIIALYNAGAKIIVDDVFYFAEPVYQDGAIAQAIDQVVAGGAIYFSAAGNDGHKGFEAAFTSSGVVGPYGEQLAKLTTSGSGQFLQVTIPKNVSIGIVLTWNEPSASVSPAHTAQNDLDVFLYNNAGTNLLAQSTNDNVGGDPYELIEYTNNSNATSFKIAIGLWSGAPPTDFKLMVIDNGGGASVGASSLNTNDGTVYGHSAAAGTIAVGAAYYEDTPAYGVSPPVVENYSSGGPTKIWFDKDGNALPTPEIRQTPDFVAPDGGDTTSFGSDSDGDGLPNFFGTSAAAPNAAAVGALMLQANGLLNNSDIRNLLKDSAIDMNNPATPGFDTGFDYGTGAGFIQADRAVAFAKTLNITGDASNNLLLGTHLNDRLDGAGGTDTAKFSGHLADYALSYDGAGHTLSIADHRAGTPDGTDTTVSVEQLQFVDATITNTFDGAGRLTSQSMADVANASPWASQLWSYDTAGRLTAQTVNNDNGTHWTNSYDAANTQSWTWITSAYDASNNLTSQTTTNDNGSHSLTLFDVANAYPWAQATLVFDANWTMTAVSGTNDNGTHTVTIADVATAYDIALWFATPYDANWNAAHDLLLA